MSDADVWSGVVSALVSDRRCITVEWPFGAHCSPMRTQADLSPPGLARLVIEVLDRIGLERATLVGNDSGGVIAQLALATAPERLSSVVLVACDAFECPVLVVWACQNRLFAPSPGERLAAAFPRGRLAIIPEARTFIPHDQPLALAALIAEFTQPTEDRP